MRERCIRCNTDITSERFLGAYCRECICKSCGAYVNQPNYIETKLYTFIQLKNREDLFLCFFSQEYCELVHCHFNLEFHYDESSNKVIMGEDIPLSNVIYCIRNKISCNEAYNINTELVGADTLDFRSMIKIIR